jgi:hypothetical protein
MKASGNFSEACGRSSVIPAKKGADCGEYADDLRRDGVCWKVKAHRHTLFRSPMERMACVTVKQKVSLLVSLP